MSRWLVASLVLAAACSKSAGPQNQEATQPSEGGGEKIAVPTGAAPEGAPGSKGPSVGAAPGGAGGAADDQFKLKPEEGKLTIEVPADAKAGAEVTARILVTPVEPYHMNLEFPTKVTLSPPAGVKIDKPELKAGGADKTKGDADALEDKQLAFTVKLTPDAGSHTISGTFKFAVCDKDTCLAKKEQISIVVAAK